MARRHTWQISDARKRLSELVDKAQTEGPQIISKRRKEVVVVVAKQEFTGLQSRHPSLVKFFRESPLVGVGLDLERDRSLPRGVA